MMLTKISNPCYKCEIRRAGCHSVCPAYILWKKEVEEIRKKRVQAHYEDNYFSNPRRYWDRDGQH